MKKKTNLKYDCYYLINLEANLNAQCYPRNTYIYINVLHAFHSTQANIAVSLSSNLIISLLFPRLQTMQTCRLWLKSQPKKPKQGSITIRGVFHKTWHQWQMTFVVISYWNPCFWLVNSRFVTDFCHLSLKKGFVKHPPRSQSRPNQAYM